MTVRRGRAWNLTKPLVDCGVPRGWPGLTAFAVSGDDERLHKLSDELRLMYVAVRQWRDSAHAWSSIEDILASDHTSPNEEPDLALKQARVLVEMLENYRSVRAYFWRCLRQEYPILKSKKAQIIVDTHGDCHVCSVEDFEKLSADGVCRMVTLS